MSLPEPAPDRTAVVTGASSGIGAEFARELVRRGHQVVLVARTESKLAELAAELGQGAHVLAADLADRSARAGLLGRITALGLEPDILINNAGLSTLGPVHASDPEAEIRMVEVDVVAVVDLCSRFLPGMVARGRGAVLNVASTAAFQPLPGQAGYGAGKVFVLSYTQSLSAELKGKGVHVTVLCPGPVDTGFGETAGFTKEQADEALPAFMWVAADKVAVTALDGLAAGKLVVIPGIGNKVGAAFAKMTPTRLLLPVLARQHPGLK
ncbi:MAG: ydfG 1 [Marmoricola sp.]|nr:ydfG 1 [Marmoricola sp.]